MFEYEDLVISQSEILPIIRNEFNNYSTKVKNNYDLGTLEAYSNLLEKNWDRYQTNHERIVELKTDDNKTHHYFQSTEYTFTDVEEYYYYEHGKLLNIKNQLTSEALLNS